jgi:chitinase
MKKIIFYLFLLTICSVYASDKGEHNAQGPVALAYVTSWTNDIVDPTYITHINYSFGHVNEEFNGVRIDNEDRLRQMVLLKNQKPELKVLLSIGGWGSGRFSEMAADETNRKSFAADCQRVIQEFGLDGIDLDWEYPTTSMAGISSSPDDTDNFTLLCRNIRQAIGNNKLLTFASAANARYVDWKTATPYLDFINIMTYDLENKRQGEPPLHQAGLYRSEWTHGEFSVEESVIAHIAAGIPPEKLVLGIPFGGRGLLRGVRFSNAHLQEDYIQQWDDVAKAAWLSDKDGNYVQTYEEPRAIAHKCEFLHSKGLLGAMYWQYSSDDTGALRKAVYEGVMKITP